jgi:polar amino acid transport system substrate-binding protein
MLQVSQNVKSGELALKEVPPPALLPGGVLVRTGASLISAGTEKVVIDLGQKSLLGKAKARPELVRQVIGKARSQGILNTFHNVMSKMERPMPLGYSAAGVIEQIGSEITELKVGDRVAIAGAGYANHAEINYVPRNLTALIPEGVALEEAAYATVGSIAMQGLRLGQPELGALVVVSGLGLIGLLTVQLLKANGCRVLGIDYSEAKVEQALRLGLDEGIVLGIDDPIKAVDRFSNGRGADLTLITAATKSNQPIELAGEITRRKGQIVVIGTVGLNVPRDIYYKKELDIKISMSYGPGRYDPSYEEGGLDYPYDYVRWTEQRNMEAVLDLIARGRLDVRSLTTHRFPFARALAAYDLIQTGSEPFMGVVLEYDLEKHQEPIIEVRPGAARKRQETLGVGFIGAGNYSSLHLLPHLQKRTDVQLLGLVTATGLNARQRADKFGFAYCATNIRHVLEDSSVDAVFIATRHSTHADFAIQALNSGKQVFVEKPMVVTEDQLAALCDAYERANAQRPTGFMVGLNRRFTPMVARLKEAFKSRDAKQMIYRVNSGQISTSWLHETQEGGGMLIGEMCHFVDLMQFISGERPVNVYARAMSINDQKIADQDNLVIVISFDGGSVGTLCYNTVGNNTAPKERLEVYGGGRVAALDDFRALEITQGPKRTRIKSANRDKGQATEVAETVQAFRTTGIAPIPFDELVGGIRIIFAARQSLISGETAKVVPYEIRREMIA